MTFKNYNLKPYINEALAEINFVEPTKVQEIVIPKVLKGEKVAVQSVTGSGKTHAFLIPIFQLLDENLDEVQAVILSPTRELAQQLYNVAVQIASHHKEKPIDVRLIIGGSDRESEIKRLEKSQPQIVIGTHGKIYDLAINENVLKIYNAKRFVVDEADMVFDQDELIEVDKVIGNIQGDPQFLVFSATIPKGLRHFLTKYLENIKVIALEDSLTAKNIEHIMIPVKARAKEEELLKLFKIINPYLALIFVNTTERVDELAFFLAEKGIKVGKLHGDLEDRARKQMLRRINNLEFKYVVASDIAARGIDIEGVSHVINFDLPLDIEFYIHRSGRTARYNQTGQAISLYDYDDDEYVNKLKNKGLKPKYMKITDDGLIETNLKKANRALSPNKIIEIETHKKIPVPKKVKPGYRKKRLEKINKEIRKAKRERINKIYKKKARGNYEDWESRQ